jgi:hypothetical protein
MSPDKISGLTENDINQYISIVKTKLDNFNAITLEDYKARFFKPPPVTRATSKKPLIIPIVDASGIPGDGLKKVVWATPPFGTFKGAVLGRHGNLLYNNTTLMKKLQLMLGAQEAGNGGLKKDIALFLDEAHKRRLISDWEHKHNMKVFVLNENAPPNKHKRSTK